MQIIFRIITVFLLFYFFCNCFLDNLNSKNSELNIVKEDNKSIFILKINSLLDKSNFKIKFSSNELSCYDYHNCNSFDYNKSKELRTGNNDLEFLPYGNYNAVAKISKSNLSFLNCEQTEQIIFFGYLFNYDKSGNLHYSKNLDKECKEFEVNFPTPLGKKYYLTCPRFNLNSDIEFYISGEDELSSNIGSLGTNPSFLIPVAYLFCGFKVYGRKINITLK